MAAKKSRRWGNVKPPVGSGIDWSDQINAGLLGCWLFNEGGGNIATDIARTNHGTINGGALRGVQSTGKTLIYDGVDDYTLISGINKTSMGSRFTLSFWIVPTGALTNRGIFQLASWMTSSSPWILYIRDSSTAGRWYFSGDYRITQTINDNTRYHMVLTYDSTVWKVYRNGVLDLTYTGSIGPAAANGLYLGNGYNGYYKGVVDNWRVYTRAICHNEVLRLYTEQFAGITEPLVRIRSGSSAAASFPFLPIHRRKSNSLIGR